MARTTADRPRSSGVAIVVALIAMIVLSILGLAMLFSSTSDYAQSALVGYGLRARELAHAAAEEARLAVFRKIHWPPAQTPATGDASATPVFKQPEWHARIFKEITERDPAERGETGPLDDSPLPSFKDLDLKGLGLVPRSMELAGNAGDAEIVDVKLDLLGFRRMHYVSSDLFVSDRTYYRDPDHVLDDPNLPIAPREYTGYMRLTTRARYGRAVRTFTALHDVKVVSVAPPAYEFALFSFLPTLCGDPSQPSVDAEYGGVYPPEEYSWNDLNSGGALRLFAYGQGRVFVRGPFVVDTEGITNGTGRDRPPRSASYLSDKFWSWQMVPPPRAWNAEGWLWRLDPKRPERTQGRTVCLPSMQSDPGYHMKGSQRCSSGRSSCGWYCEARAPDDRSFSLCGDPVNGETNVFRGVVAYLKAPEAGQDDGNQRVATLKPVPLALSGNDEPDRAALPLADEAPGDPALHWMIEPEGGLLGKCNKVSHCITASEHCRIECHDDEGYRLSTPQMVVGRYAIHWQADPSKSLLDRLRDFFNGVVTRVREIVVDARDRTSATLKRVPHGELLGRIPRAALTGLLNILGGAPAASSGTARPADTSPDEVTGAFPPGFRLMAPTRTRRYKKLGDLPSVKEGRPLILDGIVSFDDLSSEQPIAYSGRGYLHSDGPTTSVSPTAGAATGGPRLKLPIAHEKGEASHLTIWYGGGVEAPYRGDNMLTVEKDPRLDEPLFRASVYSAQGLKPVGAVTLQGNLTCGFINKSRIDAASSLKIVYDRDVLAPPRPSSGPELTSQIEFNAGFDRAQFRNGSWHAVALSHRACVALDQ